MFLIPSRFRVSLGALLLLGAGIATAQNRNALQLQFITFPTTSEIIEMEMVVSRTETQKIEVTSSELTDPIRVPRLANLVFGETVLNADNKPEFKEYGRGKPVSATKQIVLILRRGKQLSDGFEVRAVPGDMNGFGGGKFLFLNAAEIPIGGTVGGKPFALQPGHHAIIKPKLEPDGRRAFVEFAYQREDGAKPFFSSFWPAGNDSRGLIFFYRDPGRGNKITFHSYRDFLFDEP